MRKMIAAIVAMTLMLTLACARPKRYPTNPFAWVIPAGIFLLSLPILTVGILKAIKHITNELSRKKAEKLEKEQIAKGIIRYENLWGTPEQVKLWKRRDFEREQKAKTLVKYKEKLISQEEKFAREQTEKYGPKSVEHYGRAKRKSIRHPYTKRKKKKDKNGTGTPTPADRYKRRKTSKRQRMQNAKCTRGIGDHNDRKRGKRRTFLRGLRSKNKHRRVRVRRRHNLNGTRTSLET